MKEFTSAVEDVLAEDERAEKIAERVEALVAEGKDRAEAEKQAEREAEDDEGVVTFTLDGREMKAYPPTDGQLAFMLASLGRGQTKEQRFAAIINIMLEALRDDDRDYMESRLLTRDPKRRLSIKTVEGIFEHMTEEWFARPTQ